MHGGGSYRGHLRVPGDKSVTHRALLLAALAEGVSVIHGPGTGDDNRRTQACLEAMGVTCAEGPGETITVYGRGLRGLEEPLDVLDAGNSGTTMRLATGLLSGQEFFSVITGDRSLRARPMDRVVTPLCAMGASIEGRDGGRYAPLAIRGRPLTGITYDLPVPSAQVKSALLLAGLYARGLTTVAERVPSRDHTERLLTWFGADLRRDGSRVTVTGARPLTSREVRVPGDISSAAYVVALSLLAPESQVTVHGVGLNPTRTAVLTALRSMGADLVVETTGEEGGEPEGTITARTSRLKGIAIGPAEVPGLIDEIPVLAILAARAEGTTLIAGAEELRVKESDRLAALASGLRAFGVGVEETPDGLMIHGGNRLHGAAVNSYDDHRVALAFLVLSLATTGESVIRGARCMDVSYPGAPAALATLRA